MIQSIVHILFLSSSRSNEKKCFKNGYLIQTGLAKQKKTFLVTLYNSSSKIHISLCTSFYLSRGESIEKTCQASGKNAPIPGLVVPFQFSFLLSPPLLRGSERKREQTSGVVTSTKSRPASSSSHSCKSGLGLVPKRNLWFPGCWENLYLRVNLSFLLLRGMRGCLFSFGNKISVIFYS